MLSGVADSNFALLLTEAQRRHRKFETVADMLFSLKCLCAAL